MLKRDWWPLSVFAASVAGVLIGWCIAGVFR